MWRFLFRRIIQAAVTLFLLLVLVFVLARASGDPLGLLVPPYAGPETVKMITHSLGLDRPYYVQFALFVKSAAKGDLGESFRSRRPVLTLIEERLPYSIALGLLAMAFGTVLAVPLAIVAALSRGSPLDTVIQTFGSLGIAIPQFFLGLVLIELFAGQWQILPVGGAGSWKHFVLPVLTLGILQAANLIRMMRSSMLEVLSADFVTFARIKGLTEFRVIGSHVLRNAIVPVFTYAGVLIALLMTGAIVTETVFAWPGFGRLAYEATIYSDFPLIQGIVLVAGIIVIGMSLLVDVAYAFLDPRIRLE
ncbi:MAG TPA: ABC transporter permease [Polyangiaceae bacterium]|jgi:peptide/nickel transport system permease protein|nr:ABC transporter permease [Polyangiaceae bacterium]